MRTLYFDCFAGASGNMILGALLGLGVHRDALVSELRKLGLPDFDLDVSTVNRSGITSTHVEVKVPNEHAHRHLRDIVKIIDGSDLTPRIKERSILIFTRLAEAEARVHGIEVQKVHFHEVGALDAIIDVVGACIGFEMLVVEAFACSSIHVGSGFVDMEHGKFPVPPPAVVELLKGIPFYSTEITGELITPTGAAVISTVCGSYGPCPEIIGQVVAYGAGTRDYNKFPNTLRLILGETAEAVSLNGSRTEIESLLTLETNIDDVSPQVLGYVMERAMEIGALDCWFTPIQMKKNRPATMVSILCRPSDRDDLSELLFRETTTIGIRVRETTRECLHREIVTVSTRFGPIQVKLAGWDGLTVNAMPEYEQVREAAARADVSFREVHDAALAALDVPNAASA